MKPTTTGTAPTAIGQIAQRDNSLPLATRWRWLVAYQQYLATTGQQVGQ